MKPISKQELFVAASKPGDNIDLVKSLVERGASVSVYTTRTALLNNNSKIFRYLVNLGFTVDEYLLDIAIKNQDMDSIECMVEHGVDTRNALRNGARYCSVEVARYLIEHGAEISDVIIRYSIEYMPISTLEYLVDYLDKANNRESTIDQYLYNYEDSFEYLKTLSKIQ